MASKRALRCKEIGGALKKRGHALEVEFVAQFGDTSSAVTYKPEADARITRTDTLKKLASLGVTGDTCSLKSGKSIQFTLGRDLLPDGDIAPMKTSAFWEQHLAKTKSDNPAQFMVYRSESEWVFFSMADVVQHLVERTTWRTLASGRIKGDVSGRQYLTYEHRKTASGKHKGYFLGANCGKGRAWVELLKGELAHISLPAEGTR